VRSNLGSPRKESTDYLKSKAPADKQLACNWWNSKKEQFATLYLVAARYLSIPATSTSSE